MAAAVILTTTVPRNDTRVCLWHQRYQSVYTQVAILALVLTGSMVSFGIVAIVARPEGSSLRLTIKIQIVTGQNG